MIKHLRIYVLFLIAGCTAPAEEITSSTQPHWELSAEYVANTMLQSNASIAEALRYKQFVQLRGRDLPQVYLSYQRMARRMGLYPLPALYLDKDDRQALPQAAARFTREGKSYIIINPRAQEVWSSRELIAVLGHELVHLKERHVTAQSLAEAFNHPEISVTHELEADRLGSGPLGSCDPQALEDALQIVADIDMKDYRNKNPFKASDDYNTLIGADHPHMEQRKAALDEMAANPSQNCIRASSIR